jgi:hypothetical protein
MLDKIRNFLKSKAVKELEKRVTALELINTQRAANRQARFNKTKKQSTTTNA